MTKITVDSTICGFTHTITGQLEGDKVIIDIDTPCEKIKEFSHMEVPTMEIFGIDDNYVIRKAKDAKCSSTCLIPCAVLHMCNLEAGFLSKNLAERSGSISIIFEP
ncbi:hypothetical protein LI82_08055 [Methanococcoides methylutens]|uniref:Uncharacterized protein n=1 Tax=Methanococcoides methylutens TaxID=2226 RepID=A0A099SYK1_METMT|nr:hypothetical protein [Methanococcoides methylutens]KGK97724.1 hypothetical protein LI82_08055 [Methanococcoides methylutens]